MADFQIKSKKARKKFILGLEKGSYTVELTRASPFKAIEAGKIFKEFSKIDGSDSSDEDKGSEILELIEDLFSLMIYDFKEHRDFILEVMEDVEDVYGFLEAMADKWTSSNSKKKLSKKKTVAQRRSRRAG